MDSFITAFLFTCIAGLSMIAGSCLVFAGRGAGRRFMSVSLGFSAGVMICLSVMDIFPEACEHFAEAAGEAGSTAAAAGAFFCGIVFMVIIGKLIEASGHSHGAGEAGGTYCDHKADKSIDIAASGYETGNCRHGSGGAGNGVPAASGECSEEAERTSGLMRAGIVTAVSFAAHNFPEGLTTFISALQGVNVAVPIVIAIAIHNIPAGIAIAAPIYNASGSRAKALKYSFLSAMAEPAGALAGWLALMPFMNDTVFGIMFAAAAGIMIYISIDELLPSSAKYGSHKLGMSGFVAGMAVMALSLVLL